MFCCSDSTQKTTFFALNILCAVVGLVVASICALLLDTLHTVHLTYCFFGIAVGFATFVATFLSCQYKRGSKVLIIIYIIIFTLLIVVQAAIMTHFTVNHFVESATRELTMLWRDELKQPGAMAKIEKEFKCCGLKNWKDYEEAKMPLPEACYAMRDHTRILYNDGCLEKLTFIAQHEAHAVKIANWILTSVQGVVLVFAMFMAMNCSPEEENYVAVEEVHT